MSFVYDNVSLLFQGAKTTVHLQATVAHEKVPNFCQLFLDDTHLLKKMAIVNAIKEIPSPVKSAIARINDFRNAIAHSFFPENRRQYKAHKKVMYRDANIFTKESVTKFSEDAQRAQDYLMQQAFGVNPADARAEIEA